MDYNTLIIPSSNESISYYDLYNSNTQNKLRELNKGQNIIYCTCNGTSSNNWVKMMTRRLNNDNYILANYPNSKKHHINCPRNKHESEIAEKGRIYNLNSNYFPLNVITSGPNKVIDNTCNKKFNNLFGIGEYLLTKAHNDYCKTYNKMVSSKVILSELFNYHHEYCNGNIKSPLDNLIVHTSDEEIHLQDIIFNPKWIPCNQEVDKTYSAVKHFRIINRKFNKPKSITKAYLLLKYIGYEEAQNNQVKLKLYTKGKNTKFNNDKFLYAYVDKDVFTSTLNKYLLGPESTVVDYYLSGLAFVKKQTLILDEFCLIPTYPNYCIPVDSLAQLEIVKELLQKRDKLLVFPICKLDNSFNKEFDGYIPDFIVENKITKQKVLIEVFDKHSPLYYQVMINKTLFYEKLCTNTEYEFLGYYSNLGWKFPPVHTLAFHNFKTLSNLSTKVLKNITY